jgi:hypothetical protein
VRQILALLTCIFSLGASLPAAVAVNVDADAASCPGCPVGMAIRPEIYGWNNVDSYSNGTPNTAAMTLALQQLKLGLARWGGGNNSTRYNWKVKGNTHPDWYFNNYPEDHDAGIAYIKGLGATQALFTMPAMKLPGQDKIIVAADATTAYGGPYGSGNCGTCNNQGPYWTSNFTSQDEKDWLAYMNITHAGTKYVKYWEMDNEAMIWGDTHSDVHTTANGFATQGASSAEYWEDFSFLAPKLKDTDPNIIIGGDVPPNYYFYFFDGNYNRPAADGWDMWFLRQAAALEISQGRRILDVLSLHYYPSVFGNASATDDAIINETRTWWDSSYTASPACIGGYPEYCAPRILPRMKAAIDANYPGTGLAFSEYVTGGERRANAAIANGLVWGLFGKYGVAYSTLWDNASGLVAANGTPTPAYHILYMYTHYFGVTACAADTGNTLQVASFASLTAQGDLALMLINPTSSAQTANVSLANFASSSISDPATYTYSGASPGISTGSLPPVGSSFSHALPAYSQVCIVIPKRVGSPTATPTYCAACSPTSTPTISPTHTFTATTTPVPLNCPRLVFNGETAGAPLSGLGTWISQGSGNAGTLSENAASAQSGSNGLAARFLCNDSGWWAGLGLNWSQFNDANAWDLTGYQSIEFHLRSATGTVPGLSAGLTWVGGSASMDLTFTVGTTWQKVVIPFSALAGINAAQVTEFNIGLSNGANFDNTVYVDNIQLIGPCVAGSATPSPSRTRTLAPLSSTFTQTFTATLSRTPTSTNTRTATASDSPSPSSSPSPTTTFSPTATTSPRLSSTYSPSPSITPSQTLTMSSTTTASPGSSTATPWLSDTQTLLPTGTSTETLSPSPTSTPSATYSLSASPSADATHTDSPTFGASATESATPSVSETTTLTTIASASFTSTPSLTDLPTSNASPTSSATPLVSFSPTDSPSTLPTMSPSATATPSLSLPTATASRTSTSSAPLTASFTRTPAPSLADDPGTPGTLKAYLLPNPNPQKLCVRLIGPSQSIQLRLYSSGLNRTQALSLPGRYAQGWNTLPLPQGWDAGLANGCYYAQVESDSAGGMLKAPEIIKLYLSR